MIIEFDDSIERQCDIINDKSCLFGYNKNRWLSSRSLVIGRGGTRILLSTRVLLGDVCRVIVKRVLLFRWKVSEWVLKY